MTTDCFIDVADLSGQIGQADLLIVDCRFRLTDPEWGRSAWLDAHLPGAIYADLDQDLSDRSKRGGRHPLPDGDVFCEVLGRWGLTENHRVVAYDDASGAIAARLWWMLKHWGHEQVQVLDGGFPAWTQAGLPVESGPVEVAPTRCQGDFGQRQTVSDAEVESGQVLLVDARSEVRFRGEQEPIDPVAGHVPGAVNVPFERQLDGSGKVRPVDEIRMLWEPLLADPTHPPLAHMCGSGVTACFNLLVLEHAGLPGGALYPGSWSGWIENPDHAVAVGE